MHTEEKIIEKLKKLPPKRLDEVIHFIDSITEMSEGQADDPHNDDLNKKILNLRGRGKGEKLVKRLLKSRQKDLKLD